MEKMIHVSKSLVERINPMSGLTELVPTPTRGNTFERNDTKGLLRHERRSGASTARQQRKQRREAREVERALASLD